MRAGCLLMSITETGSLWIRPLLVSVKWMCAAWLCKQQVKRFKKALWRPKNKLIKKPSQGVCTAVSRWNTSNNTKCDKTHLWQRERQKKPKTSLDFHLAADSFGCPDKIGSVLLLIHKHTHTFIHTLAYTHSTHIHTRCTYMMQYITCTYTDINTYSFSLNALLCPQFSALKIGRCINKTFPSLQKWSMHVQHLWVLRDWMWRKYEGREPSGCIPFHLISWFLLLSQECVVVSPLSGRVLTLYLSFVSCLSQMGAVLCIEPVALWEPGAALPAAALIGYQREGVWSDQVPADGAQTHKWNPLIFCICFHAVFALSIIFAAVYSHNIVQLQSGVWRRVDEDIGQSVPLVSHPIWHRKKRGEWGRK